MKKSYVGYSEDGKLTVNIVRTGGFDTDCDLTNPDCEHPLAVSLRENPAIKECSGVVEIMCSCDCSPSNPCSDPDCKCTGVCQCSENKRHSHFFCPNNQCLTKKPDADVYLNGSLLGFPEMRVNITLTPGQSFTLQLKNSTIDDGAVVDIGTDILSPQEKHQLTFNDGETNILTLVAPAQGVRGLLSIDGTLIVPKVIRVLGFAE